MGSWQKLLIIMKLVIILLFAGIMQIHAAAYSQGSYNFNEQSVTVRQMFKKIEKEGKYTLFYRLDQVNLDQKVQVDSKNGSIDDVMKQVLQKQSLSYQVMGDIIVIKPIQDESQRVNSFCAGQGNLVHLTSSDAHATLPVDAPLTSGQATFTVTVPRPGWLGTVPRKATWLAFASLVTPDFAP